MSGARSWASMTTMKFFGRLRECTRHHSPTCRPADTHTHHSMHCTSLDVTIRRKYGPAVKQLFVDKILELEKYNPSGRYPVPKLWFGGSELQVSDAVKKVVGGMRSLYRTLQTLQQQKETRSAKK